MADNQRHLAPPSGVSSVTPGAGEVADSNVTQPGPSQLDGVRGVVDSNVSFSDEQVVTLETGGEAGSNVSPPGDQVLPVGNAGGVQGSNVSPPGV